MTGRKIKVFFIIFVLVIVSLFIAYQTAGIRKQIKEYDEADKILAERIEDESIEQEHIRDRIAFKKSDDYIIQQAREKLGLVFDGEIIFKKKEQ